MEERKTTILAVAGKGGVGKTSVAACRAVWPTCLTPRATSSRIATRRWFRLSESSRNPSRSVLAIRVHGIAARPMKSS